MPECGFSIDYTVTLIEKGYQSSEQPSFTPDLEGQTPIPEFMLLDLEANTLTIEPTSGQLLGKSYAVYIRGHLHVNETIQEPMSTLSDYFDISVPP